MKNSRDLILGEFVYIAIIYHIPDSRIYLLNGYDFSSDHMTGENRELIRVRFCNRGTFTDVHSTLP